MQILNGKEVSIKIRSHLKSEIQKCLDLGKRPPGLAVVLVGDDSASQVYVKNKMKSCAEVGILSFEFKLPKNTSFVELKSTLAMCASDERIDGILVQLPLPVGPDTSSLDTSKVIELIPQAKDVDGLTPGNLGLLFKAQQKIAPCTPFGVMEILKFYGHDVAGKNVVVVGRSQIVGLPMAQLMIQANATVTVVHSQTKNIADYLKVADIVVVAAGKPKFLNKSHFKKDAIVIDVGIHRGTDGKLCGDVDTDGLAVQALTPVPGGVGPMTIAMLLKNTVVLYKQRIGLYDK